MKKLYFILFSILSLTSLKAQEVYPVDVKLDTGEYVLLHADTNGVDFSTYYGIVEIYQELGVSYFSFGKPIVSPISWNSISDGYHSLDFQNDYYQLMTFNNGAVILYHPETNRYYAVVPKAEFFKAIEDIKDNN